MIGRSVEDFHNSGAETLEKQQKRARMADRSVPISLVEREITFMLSSSNRINNTMSGNAATIANEVGTFFHRRPNLALLVTEEACQVELMAINMFNYVPPIPSSFLIRMQCTPIAFGEREGAAELAGSASQVLTPDLGTYYPVGSIAGFYNFDPIKLSQVPAHFAFDIRECTTNSYFPAAVQSVDLEVVITFKIERLGDSA